MAKIRYQTIKFPAEHLRIIAQAEVILADFAQRGFSITLRTLFYQFVTKLIIPNKHTEYKRLGTIIANARLAGLIDWDHLQDRTRSLTSLSHWENPADIINGAARSYHRALWEGQDNHVEVWIEKDALVGVIEHVCARWDVAYLSCRGYTSISEMWASAMRLKRHERGGQQCTILHFGDHDPSGKDMTRDIEERLRMFGSSVNVLRCALNMNQIEQYNPPPNPTKLTDCRSYNYVEEFGHECWELDALDPAVIEQLIDDSITNLVDLDLWEARRETQENERAVLTATSTHWQAVAKFVEQRENLL